MDFAEIELMKGYDGQITYDNSKPDGTPLKQLDISKALSYGWKPRISLRSGIKALMTGLKTYSKAWINDEKLFPVILSGGSGDRLWPKSRKSLPKQFIAFNEISNLFSQTLKELNFSMSVIT